MTRINIGSGHNPMSRAEEWRPVEFDPAPTRYEVSNLGRVRNKETKVEKKQTLINSGYFVVYFSYKHKSYSRLVHRLVASAFLSKDPSRNEVNHKDCNKTNNYSDNLEWVTRAENVRHSFDNGLSPAGSRHKNSKLSDSDVAYVREQRGRMSGTELASMFGVCKQTISLVQRGISRSRTFSGAVAKPFRKPIKRKLDYIKAQEILDKRGSVVSRRLAIDYGVSATTIKNIWRGSYA